MNKYKRSSCRLGSIICTLVLAGLAACNSVLNDELGADLTAASSSGSLGPRDFSAAQVEVRMQRPGHTVSERASLGSDPGVNANGIRDDVSQYINSLNLTGLQKEAARQMARAYQAAVTTDSADKDVTKSIDNQIRDAIMCTYKRLPYVAGNGIVTAHQVVSDLEKLTANTSARVLTYERFNRSRNGTVTLLPGGDGCRKEGL